MGPDSGHREGGAPDGALTPSGCYSPREYGHPRAVYRQKSDAADQGECPKEKTRRKSHTSVCLILEMALTCKLGGQRANHARNK